MGREIVQVEFISVRVHKGPVAGIIDIGRCDKGNVLSDFFLFAGRVFGDHHVHRVHLPRISPQRRQLIVLHHRRRDNRRAVRSRSHVRKHLIAVRQTFRLSRLFRGEPVEVRCASLRFVEGRRSGNIILIRRNRISVHIHVRDITVGVNQFRVFHGISIISDHTVSHRNRAAYRIDFDR